MYGITSIQKHPTRVCTMNTSYQKCCIRPPGQKVAGVKMFSCWVSSCWNCIESLFQFFLWGNLVSHLWPLTCVCVPMSMCVLCPTGSGGGQWSFWSFVYPWGVVTFQIWIGNCFLYNANAYVHLNVWTYIYVCVCVYVYLKVISF